MRIAGEIVNHGSAAADLTLSRSAKSATWRPDPKVGDRYCSLSPARPFGNMGASADSAEELPKKRQPTEISSNWQPRCPSAGRASNIDVGLVHTVGAIRTRIVHIRAPVAQAPWPSAVNRSIEKERRVQVLVRDNNVDQALKVLKKKMQREGVFREMKLRARYEKPSERRVREKAEARRRARKLARKKLQREGLLPMKPRVAPGVPGRGGPARTPRF